MKCLTQRLEYSKRSVGGNYNNHKNRESGGGGGLEKGGEGQEEGVRSRKRKERQRWSR